MRVPGLDNGLQGVAGEVTGSISELSARTLRRSSSRIPSDQRTSRAATHRWDHGEVSRREVYLQLDEELLAAARAESELQGRSEAEVIELALRKYLVPLEVLDRIWARTGEGNVDPDEAMALAYEELKAARAERRAKNAS